MSIITIDGQSACGKNTIGNLLAQRNDFDFVDGGLIMRTFSYLYNPDCSIDQVFDWRLYNYVSEKEIYYESANIAHIIKSENTARRASQLGGNIVIAEHISIILRQIAEYHIQHNRSIVFTGRSLGNETFIDADIKLFFTASPHVRAERRYNELINNDPNITYEQIYDQISLRDTHDTQKIRGQLMPAYDSVIIETSNKSIEEIYLICEKIINIRLCTE